MRVEGEKFTGILRQDNQRSGWICFLTYKLGYRGDYLIKADNEEALRIRLRKLDSSVRFFNKGGGWC
jgi:hypothetical protein